MIREIRSAVLHNTFKAFISAETAIKKIGGGKLVSNIFDVEPKYVGSSVRILKETDDATFIAKYDAKGRIDNKNFKIMVTTDLHLWDEKDLINKSLDMLAKHLAAEKPDLLLITGDAILTDYQQLDCSLWKKQASTGHTASAITRREQKRNSTSTLCLRISKAFLIAFQSSAILSSSASVTSKSTL